MPDDTVCTNSLVSSNQTDDALMSIAENFEVLIVVISQSNIFVIFL